MRTYLNDFIASIVVFLVALPLCMGISIASGVPPGLGLITGMVGGIVVGSLAGAPLQVSGPAAGLTVLVFEIVRDHGIAALGPIVLLAGLVQFIAGRLKAGSWFRAMSPAVIYGMLAGIGVLIFASQFHVMLDDKPKGSGIENLLYIPTAIAQGVFPLDGSKHEIAALLGLLTIATLIAWDKFKRGRAKFIPGALAGIVIASKIAATFRLPVQYVTVPDNLLEALTLPSAGTLSTLAHPSIMLSALALAFIASAETLLCATAVDRLQTLYRTDYDRSECIGELVDPKNLKRLRSYGRWPVAVYAATVVAIVCTDLLTGVLTGVFLSAARLVYKVTHLQVVTSSEENRVRVNLIGVATFVRLPKLAHALESLPMRSEVHLDVQRLAYIDDSCLDLVRSWTEQYEAQGGVVVVEWDEVEKRFAPIHTSPVLNAAASH
ncbi:MAG TPA: SulP family inorganic anion transporter [Bryobacteraceae bacterium]|nr:SulP family inorganic anion transporter [Bryobacteraceae bacterium]